jgi:hypothetical protein
MNIQINQDSRKVSPLGFDVISMGPDGRIGSPDDIVN